MGGLSVGEEKKGGLRVEDIGRVRTNCDRSRGYANVEKKGTG